MIYSAMVRVIAGSARRLQLKTLDSYDMRPTQDIIKETLFNSIQTLVPGSHFLDLFAGSGAIGIEALSRGASKAVFVENNRAAAALINENLEHTHLAENADVLVSDALVSLRGFNGRRKFDLIYIDPPYKAGLYEPVLRSISSLNILNEDALVIVEALRETDFSYLESLGFDTVKDKLYKNNRHLFLKFRQDL